MGELLEDSFSLVINPFSVVTPSFDFTCSIFSLWSTNSIKIGRSSGNQKMEVVFNLLILPKSLIPPNAVATALGGISDFGKMSKLNTTSIFWLPDDLPILIEFVDHKENIEHVKSKLGVTTEKGLITKEKESSKSSPISFQT